MLDETLGLELQKRVADGAAADPEVLGERAVGEPPAGGHLPIHDHPPQLAVGLGRQVLGLVGAGWHVRISQKQVRVFAALNGPRIPPQLGPPPAL